MTRPRALRRFTDGYDAYVPKQPQHPCDRLLRHGPILPPEVDAFERGKAIGRQVAAVVGVIALAGAALFFGSLLFSAASALAGGVA